MIGALFAIGSTFIDEIGTSVGKWEVMHKKESMFSLGFLNAFWALVFLAALAFIIPTDFIAPGFPGGWVFSAASLPTFLPRLLLEIIESYVTVQATVLADRSTFGFIRIITIPLLLAADFAMGYAIGIGQMFGMLLIVCSLILLFINHGIRRKGAWLVAFSAANAVVTISLYKYDITHFNSAAAEQILVTLGIMAFFFLLALAKARQNPLRLMFKPVFFAQSVLMGLGGVMISMAYVFSAASVITSLKRASTVLFAVLSGRIYFREKKLLLKLVSYGLILAGLFLLAA